MNATQQLLELQWAQLRHDEVYHKDVVILPLAQRIKHMALHHAKYTGYFLESVDGGDQARFVKTLVDAFIITLASANALNQDLGRELGEMPSTPTSLSELGRQLQATLPRNDTDPLWLVRAFARHNGTLAKVCESWDHLESIQFRDLMRQSNLSLLKAVVIEGSSRELDLARAYETRIREVETRSIFDQHFRARAGGTT